MSSRRLFFALWPDDTVVEPLSAWARQAHAAYGGRAMRPDTLHLTLAFLGEVPCGRIAALRAVLQEAAWAGGVLHLDRFGRFRGPRIVWAGPSMVPSWLDALHAALWSRLTDLGFEAPSERFRPHVSLLRRAAPGGLEALTMDRPVIWTARRCVLVASTPRDTGSFYDVLAETELCVA